MQCHRCNVFGHDEVHYSQKIVIPKENEVLRAKGEVWVVKATTPRAKKALVFLQVLGLLA